MQPPDPLLPATFIPLGCAPGEVGIEVDPAEPPAAAADVLERWAAASATNPRLFNGPILRFLALDPERRVIRAARDTYQRYSMQAFDRATSTPGRDIYHLSVTGVLIARQGDGRESVLLGRRGRETMLYPGLWELAPGGGLDSTDVYGQLLQEMEEELGIGGLMDGSRRDELIEPPEPRDVLGVAIDPNTPSADVVVRVRLRSGAERALGNPSWEYGSTRFVPVDSLGEFLRQEDEHSLIPPSAAILRVLGWLLR